MDRDDSSPRKVMTAREVSAYLKMPMTTLYEMVAKGKLPAVKCGRQWRFFESDVLNYLHGIKSVTTPKASPGKRLRRRINSPSPKVMTSREVSAYLKLPMTTLYEMVAKGKLPAVKCGRQWRFFESDVINYLHGIQGVTTPRTPYEKRLHQRIKSCIHAKLKGTLPETRNLMLSGLIRDISAGGVCFAFSPDSTDEINGRVLGLESEHPVEMTFALDEPTPAEMKLKGRIVRITHNGALRFAPAPVRGHLPSGTCDSGTVLGIKFRHLFKEEQEIICDYVG